MKIFFSPLRIFFLLIPLAFFRAEAQVNPTIFSYNLNQDPWGKLFLDFTGNRVSQLIADPTSLLLFVQGNMDDFSPYFFKRRMGDAYLASNKEPKDWVSAKPLAGLIDISFNFFLVIPNLNIKVHPLREGPFWPQVSFGLNGWFSPFNVLGPVLNLGNLPAVSGIAPSVVLSKSLTSDAKLFIGYELAIGAIKNQGTFYFLGTPVNGIEDKTYFNHEFFIGAVFLGKKRAETSVYLAVVPEKGQIFLKTEISGDFFTGGFGLFPDHVLGILPLPYARFRVRIE